jgi:hypothetical protein
MPSALFFIHHSTRSRSLPSSLTKSQTQKQIQQPPVATASAANEGIKLDTNTKCLSFWMLCSAQQENEEKEWAMSVPSGFSPPAKIPEIDTSAPGVGRRLRLPSRGSPLMQERSGRHQWRIRRSRGLWRHRAREGFGGGALPGF